MLKIYTGALGYPIVSLMSALANLVDLQQRSTILRHGSHLRVNSEKLFQLQMIQITRQDRLTSNTEATELMSTCIRLTAPQ